MEDLTELQAEHREWVSRNFGGQEPWEPLMGLIEEVGELAHAHLKGHQGIRVGTDGTATAHKKMDAIGDIVIFLASYCNANNFDLAHCVAVTWRNVKKRNWVDDPEGVTAT